MKFKVYYMKYIIFLISFQNISNVLYFQMYSNCYSFIKFYMNNIKISQDDRSFYFVNKDKTRTFDCTKDRICAKFSTFLITLLD